MSMRKRMALLGVVALLVALVAPVSSVPVAGGITQEDVDADKVVLDVSLQPDGDAVWAVEYRVRLATDNETAAFEDIQADVRANESRYTGPFGDRMARTADTASNATGREMTIENVSVSAEQKSLPQAYGVVTYRFRWTNFAAVEGEAIRAGDSLAGFFLDDQTSVRIAWPDGYAASEVAPAGDEQGDDEVVWRGPREFGDTEPTVVVEPEQQSTGAVGGLLGSPLGICVAVLLAAALAGGAVVVRRRPGGLGGLLGVSDSDDADGDGGSTAATASADANGDADGQKDDSAADADSGDADGPPPELLSNEEQVLQLLEASDGRMKQGEVADRLDWTAAKTSQVIGDMREADAIATFRLGRENVVTLPDRGLGEDLGPDDDI